VAKFLRCVSGRPNPGDGVSLPKYEAKALPMQLQQWTVMKIKTESQPVQGRRSQASLLPLWLALALDDMTGHVIRMRGRFPAARCRIVAYVAIVKILFRPSY
jgi:hypothetical protein